MVACFIVWLERGPVDPDILGVDDLANLKQRRRHFKAGKRSDNFGKRTRSLKSNKPSCVKVSAFATTGMRLTRVPRRFMISMSRGLRLLTTIKKRREEEKQKLTCVLLV